MCSALQVRRNKHVEIVPLSTGCLGACTYCKTRHARGALGSYQLQAIAQRVSTAAADPRVRRHSTCWTLMCYGLAAITCQENCSSSGAAM